MGNITDLAALDGVTTHMPVATGIGPSIDVTLNYNVVPAFVPFCLGDGSDGVICPCSNASTIGSGEGCTHSGSVGAYITASGTPSIAADTLSLTINQAEANEFGIFVSNIATGAPVPFFDGAFCLAVDANVSRHFYDPVSGVAIPVAFDGTGAGSNSYPLSVTDYTGLTVAGATVHYQAWFRSPSGPCGNAANISSGVSVTWTP